MRDARYSRVKRHFQLALVLTFCMMPLQGATLERLSLDDMISKSTAIVRGTVVGSYAALSGPAIYTHYSIQVAERLKGGGGGSVELVVPGGVANGLRMSVSGAPVLNTGDEFVFFLYTGKSGITSILGLTQGLFSLVKGASDPTATRTASRELMLDPVTARPVKDETLVMPLSQLRTRIAGGLKAK
jgi:hypothetical protein